MIDNAESPFVKRREILATIHNLDHSVENLHTVIEYSLVEPSRISGTIYGTSSEAHSLIEVIQRGGRCSLSSHDPYERLEVEAGNVWTESATLTYSSRSHKATHEIATFEVEEISFTRKFDLRENTTRKIIFYLSGPRTAWNSSWRIVRGTDGSVRPEFRKQSIDVSSDLPIAVETDLQLFREVSVRNSRLKIETDVLSIVVTTTVAQSALSDVDFVSSAIDIVEELLLFISFVSKGWTVWYMYELVAPDNARTVVRKATRRLPETDPPPDDLLVDPPRISTFLRSAFVEAKRQRQAGMDLRMPIIHYLTSREAIYIESQYTTLFTALERLKNSFDRSDGGAKVLPGTRFRFLRARLQAAIEETVVDETAREEIFEKLSGLNRPSMRKTLERMFTRYDVNWTDLYPPHHELTLINTRNHIVHSTGKIDYALLMDDLVRLYSVVERLLLRLLGWPDISRSPHPIIGPKLQA